MISPLDFLRLAEMLANGAAEADWRTSVSRAYYAAFHEGRLRLMQLGFEVPQSDRGHAFVAQRLAYWGEPLVRPVGTTLISLRRDRNRADYELNRAVPRNVAYGALKLAHEAIAQLQRHLSNEETETLIDSIRRYEADVLREPTWRKESK